MLFTFKWTILQIAYCKGFREKNILNGAKKNIKKEQNNFYLRSTVFVFCNGLMNFWCWREIRNIVSNEQ